jgi:hypothetical protein
LYFISIRLLERKNFFSLEEKEEITTEKMDRFPMQKFEMFVGQNIKGQTWKIV